MKLKNLCLVLLILLFGSQYAHAWEVNVGDGWFGYTKTYEIYGGLYDFNVQLKKVEPYYLGLGSFTELDIPSSVRNGLFYYSVKAIASEACNGLAGLQKVNLPSGLEVIFASAFQNCTGLSSLTLPGTVFYIYPDAFSGCTGLQELTLPSRLSTLNKGAFANCSSLHSVSYYSSNPATLYDNTFTGLPDDCVLYIPYGMEETYAAKGWTSDVFKGGVVAETVFEYMDLTYRVTGNSTVEVVGYNGDATDVVVPESATHYLGTFTSYTVTGLAEGAFENQSTLTSITLPGTITSIGDRAFAGCSGLTAMNVGMTTAPSVTASMFTDVVKANCKLYVPQGTASAYSSWRTYFATIVDGETFTETVNGVATTFLITGATTVQLGDGAVAIPTDFAGAYPIPETVEHDGVTYTVTAIGASAFNGCSGLTGEMVVPGTVTSIGQRAFQGCTGITSAEIPDGIRALPAHIFRSCTSLASVSLPEGLEVIFGYAFNNCPSLTELTIPSTVFKIDQYALKGTALNAITAKMLKPCGLAGNVFGSTSACKLIVPQGTRDAYINNGWTEDVFTGGVVEDGQLWGYTEEGVKFLATVIDEDNNGVQIFNGVLSDYGWEPDGPAIDVNTTGPLTIPASFEYLGQTYYVKEIGESAFLGCKGITSLTIPEGVTKVGPKACWQCTALESVSLPSSLDEIGNTAFRECDLTTVVLPEHLTKLGQYAFAVNRELTTITLPAELTEIGSGVFHATDLLSVIAMNPSPAQLTYTGIFWPDQTRMNPVVMTVPYGTRQRYLDAGYTESQGSEIGVVYKIVEQAVEKNHSFLQVGEGATVLVSHMVNWVTGNRRLTPNSVYQTYLEKSSHSSGHIYYRAEEGYTVKILRNGVDVSGVLELRDGWFNGELFKHVEIPTEDMEGPDGTTWSMNDNVTWQIVVTPEDGGSSSSDVNVGDVNQDGTISIADVTALVNIILGKAVAPGPLSNVTLDYDVLMKPDGYTTLDIPVSDRLVNAFRLTPAQIASKLLSTPAEPQNGEIELVSYKADGTACTSYGTNYASGELGYWFEADGYPESWSQTSKAAVWFDKNAAKFVISCHPMSASGDALTAQLVLIYKNDSGTMATATVNFHITYDADAVNAATLR